MYFRKSFSKILEEWTISYYHFRAICFEREKITDILLDSDTSDEKEYRRFQFAKEFFRSGVKQCMIDSEWEDTYFILCISMVQEIVLHIFVRYEYACWTIVDILQGFMYPFFLNEWDTKVYILRYFRMKGRSVWEREFFTGTSCRKSDGSFCCDVDIVGFLCLDYTHDVSRCYDGQAYFAICRTGDRREPISRYDRDFEHFTEMFREFTERYLDTIYLSFVCVSENEEFFFLWHTKLYDWILIFFFP